jgi:hypothetical protein
MNVILYKKEGFYVDKQSGETRKSGRFYLACGNVLVPIQPCYFENAQTGRDPQFAGRKEVMKAFATELPAKEGNVHADEEIPS